MFKLSTTLLCLAACSTSLVTAQNNGPIPSSIIMVLPPDGLTVGQELSVGVTRAPDTTRDQMFFAYQVYVVGHDEPSGAFNNVTGMMGWQSAGGSFNLGNSSYSSAWNKETGDFTSPSSDGPTCSSGSTGGSLATFKYNTTTWPAGAYNVNIREIVYYGSKGVEKVNDTTWCISPPFTNYSVATTTYVNLVAGNASSSNGQAVQEATTTVTFPTGTNAYGGQQTAPANPPSGSASKLGVTAGLAVSTLAGLVAIFL